MGEMMTDVEAMADAAARVRLAELGDLRDEVLALAHDIAAKWIPIIEPLVRKQVAQEFLGHPDRSRLISFKEAAQLVEQGA